MIRRVCLCFVLMLTTAAAPVTIPNTTAGLVFKAWITSFDRGDRDDYRKFLQTYNPAHVKDLDDEMQFRDRTGGFDLKKIEQSTPAKLVALMRTLALRASSCARSLGRRNSHCRT